jgi:4-hydroxy-2-oxoheptanedioate aldolase
MDLPGLKMFFFGMTDLSRVLADSRKPDWESPKLWQFVDRAVRKGRERGIVVGAIPVMPTPWARCGGA